MAWALLLIGVGFLLFRRGEGVEREHVDELPPLPVPGDPGAGVKIQPRVRRPRERSPLGWLTLGLALAVSGLVAVLRSSGTVDLSLAQTLAIPVTILGVGLLVGSLVGRARWTAVLGLPLLPLVIAASAFTVPLNGSWGDTYVTRASQVRTNYVRSGGTISLDLPRIDPNDLPPAIDVRMGAGSVKVAIPPRGVRVEATVNIGDIHTRQSSGGFDVSGSFGDPNAATVVTVHVDVGEVQAWVAAAPRSPNGG